jgi:hypothetical protein
MTSPQHIEAAGVCLAYALRTLYGVDGSTVEQAAQAALTPTGPPLDELVARITELRREAAAA